MRLLLVLLLLCSLVFPGCSKSDATPMPSPDVAASPSPQSNLSPQQLQALEQAKAQLDVADAALNPIINATGTINTKSDDAAQVTHKVQGKLDKELASFWSHRQKVLFWSFVGIVTILAIGAFVLESFGGGPLLALGGGVLSTVLSGLAKVGIFLFHVLTLGIVKLSQLVAKKLNEHYDAQQSVGKVPVSNGFTATPGVQMGTISTASGSARVGP